MRHIKLIAFLITIFFAGNAYAQCRIGSGPYRGDGVPYCSELQSPKTEIPHWQSKWGAIAIGKSTNSSVTGFSSNMNSRNLAEKSAIKECKKNGGTNSCHIELSYSNQCGVLVWGDNYFATATGDTVKEAGEKAFLECNKETQNCSIYFSDCSKPIIVW